MTDMTVSKTILTQLGGNRFTVMTGASNYTGTDTSLSMRLPSRPDNKINIMRITLAGDDTYTLEGSNVRGTKLTSIRKCEHVMVEQLRATFTAMTGLETSL